MAGLSGAIGALVAHRDSLFLKRLSEDYKLDLAELTAKYLEAPAPAEKKKRVIKVRVSEDGKEIRCQGVTAKKEQCSFGPLPGQCFCKRHLPPATATEQPPTEQPQPESPQPDMPTIPEEPTPARDSPFEELELTPLLQLETPASEPKTEPPPEPRNLLEEIETLAAIHYEEKLEVLEQEQSALLDLLREQEAEEQAALAASDLPAPYEPPADSPSPPKAPPKRRQSIRPKVAKKK